MTDYRELVRILDMLDQNNPVLSLYVEVLYCGSKLTQLSDTVIIAEADGKVDAYELK